MEVEFEIKEIEPVSNKRFRVIITYKENKVTKEKAFIFTNDYLADDNFLAEIQKFFEEQNEKIEDKIKKFKGKKFKYKLQNR